MTCVLRSYDVRSDNFETKTFASKLEGIFATLESRTSRPWQEMDSLATQLLVINNFNS